MGLHLDSQLAALAAHQHGCFSAAQARAEGASARQINCRLAGGTLVPLHRGVYALAGVPPSPARALMAATLASGGVVSHRSAATLWGLRGCEWAHLVEVTVHDRRAPLLPGVVAHTTDRLDGYDRSRRQGIPVTSPERTLLDLGAVAPPPVVEAALEDALLRQVTDPTRIERCWRRLARPGRNGSGVLRQIIEGRGTMLVPTESLLEDAVAAVLRDAGLPAPQRQVWLGPRGEGGVRIDLAYPEQRLAIECDGVTHHSRSSDVQRDARKANLLLDLGWRLLRFTWSDVREHPRELAGAVRRHLRAPAA